MKFLDWQLARFGSPVLDLSYFLYTSASKENLNDLMKLLKVYHDSLRGYLQQFDCSSDYLFPFVELQQHWKKYAKFGLGMAFLVINVMLMEENELPNVSSENQSGENFIEAFQSNSKNNSTYFRTIIDILVHFDEFELF